MDSHSNASDPPGFSADAVVAYLLAGHLQIAYGAVPARVERADTLCALRARLVRAAESALPFRLSPALDDGTTDAPDDPVGSATMLLGEPSSGAAISGVADAAEADVDGELVDALSDTLAFARRLHAPDDPTPNGASGTGSSATHWCDRVCRTVLRPRFDELASRRRQLGTDGAARRREAAAIAARIGADADRDGNADVIGRRLGGRLHELLADARTPALREAMAGLQSLIELMPACDERPDVASKLGLSATPVVHIVRNGPYIVEGGVAMTDRFGDERPVREPVALCRCGRSGSMPLCDGSHVGAGFQGAKSERQEPDRLDRHAGQQLTLRDNRGLCAHSGFCTDRLASVFHLGQEPFVSPSGARADRILQAIDKCPSGALGLELDGRAERALPEPARSSSVEVSQGGPYRFTGNVAVLDENGDPVDMPKGGTTEHYSLCRCGASLNKPFCSGMHWNVTFEKPADAVEDRPSVYEWAGGQRLLLDMTRLFYSRHVPDDPPIGPLFASMSPDHPVRVAAWLSEVFGGPALYSERYGGYAHMIREHLGKRITREQRARWVTLMANSADKAGLPDDGGVPGRVRVLPRVGFSARARELAGGGEPATAHADASLELGRGRVSLEPIAGRRPRRRLPGERHARGVDHRSGRR